MRTRNVLVIFGLVALVAIACESDDALNVNPAASRSIRLVTFIDKSTMIDLKSMSRNIKGVDLSGSAITYPDTYNNRYVRYKDCAANPKEFSFDVVHCDNSRTKINVDVARQDAATGGFRRASISNKEVLVVNLLNNPEFSGLDLFSKGEIRIATNMPGDTHYNDRNVVIDVACGNRLGNAATLTYTPPSSFVGEVRFKYYLSVNADVEEHGTKACYSSEYSQYFSSHEVVIEVTN